MFRTLSSYRQAGWGTFWDAGKSLGKVRQMSQQKIYESFVSSKNFLFSFDWLSHFDFRIVPTGGRPSGPECKWEMIPKYEENV